jgi:hypothetical protein
LSGLTEKIQSTAGRLIQNTKCCGGHERISSPPKDGAVALLTLARTVQLGVLAKEKHAMMLPFPEVPF